MTSMLEDSSNIIFQHEFEGVGEEEGAQNFMACALFSGR